MIPHEMGREVALPNEKKEPKELKVTDKRIFTPEGEIRAEFQAEIRPSEASEPAPAEPRQEAAPPVSEDRRREGQPRSGAEERRRTMADRAANPGTPFANFIQSLVMQSYMFLGMLRDPRQPQPIFDAEAARETIDVIALLKEKTAGNLSAEEQDFLDTHLGELRLAFVQRTKTI